MDPDQLASSKASQSGSTKFFKKDTSGFSRTRVKQQIEKWLFKMCVDFYMQVAIKHTLLSKTITTETRENIQLYYILMYNNSRKN